MCGESSLRGVDIGGDWKYHVLLNLKETNEIFDRHSIFGGACAYKPEDRLPGG
jgi:hypothetical protein